MAHIPGLNLIFISRAFCDKHVDPGVVSYRYPQKWGKINVVQRLKTSNGPMITDANLFVDKVECPLRYD